MKGGSDHVKKLLKKLKSWWRKRKREKAKKKAQRKHRLDADGNPLPEDTTTSSDSTNIGKG